MLTVNTKQLRALSIVAPGTLALSEDKFLTTRWLTTVDDCARSGVWLIEVDRDGNVTEHLTLDRGTIVTSYADLIARDSEAHMEAMGLI